MSLYQNQFTKALIKNLVSVGDCMCTACGIMTFKRQKQVTRKPLVESNFKWKYICVKNNMKVYAEGNIYSVCNKYLKNCTVEAHEIFLLNYCKFSALRFQHYLLPDVILNSLRCISFIGHIDYREHIEQG